MAGKIIYKIFLQAWNNDISRIKGISKSDKEKYSKKTNDLISLSKCIILSCGSPLHKLIKSITDLESITIPNSVKKIGAAAFMNCSSLKSLTIPGSVTEISVSAFMGCSSLKSITIPCSVTEIGGNALWGCSSLETVVIPDTLYDKINNNPGEIGLGAGIKILKNSEVEAKAKAKQAAISAEAASTVKELAENEEVSMDI